MMKIHCLCLVRDEADILGHTLDAALAWAHGIYVLDNGSTDGTWELLQDYARRYPQVVLVGREYGPYRTALWGQIANQFTGDAEPGDWWCRLDADELYVDDPREFLTKVHPNDQRVYSASIEYLFTDIDLAAYEQDPSRYVDEWQPERMRFYLANWSEPRFVRHTPGVSWKDAWPPGFRNMRPAPKRIRLRHFQYRSPPQIERRVRLRRRAPDEATFRHEKGQQWVPRGIREEDLAFPNLTASEREIWRTRVVRAAALHRDDCTGEYVVDWEMLPPPVTGSSGAHQSLVKRALRRMRLFG